MTEFTTLPDLALRSLGGSVIAANDESFAERESLIRPGRPGFQPHTFGAKGQVYDGWETRRRREPGHDWALVRLGLPGVIRGVVIDTAWFKGNYPPHASVEAVAVEGYPTVAELEAADWMEIVPRSELKGDAEHFFEVADERRYTHVRLNIFPDGGVARLRVHGEVRPDLAPLRRAQPGPGRAGERRAGHRLLQRVLLLAQQRHRPRPRPAPGRGLGDRPPPRRTATTGW